MHPIIALSEGFYFAVFALGFMGVLLLVGLLKAGVNDMLKIWAVLGPLFGGLIGTVGSHYFSREAVETAVAAVEKEAEAVNLVANTRIALAAQAYSDSLAKADARNDAMRSIPALLRPYPAAVAAEVFMPAAPANTAP